MILTKMWFEIDRVKLQIVKVKFEFLPPMYVVFVYTGGRVPPVFGPPVYVCVQQYLNFTNATWCAVLQKERG